MLTTGHLELFVNDPSKSRQFYEEVLGFTVTAVQAEGQLIWLQLGNQEILLRPGFVHPPAAVYEDSHVALVFYTDDLPKTAALLETRGLEFKGTDGSDQCLTFTDPDGHWFQLVNPNDH